MSINYAMFPSPYLESEWMQNQHPLLLRIAKELGQLGCECIRNTPPIKPSLTWLVANHRATDVIHFHWPEQFYSPAELSAWALRLRQVTNALKLKNPIPFLYFLHFWIFLKLALLLKVPLVWTLHDLYPHGQSNGNGYHQKARKLLMRHIEVLIVNCCSAKQLAIQEFGQPKQVIVAPLGNYREFYSDAITTDDARQQLGVQTNEIVFLYFGTMRTNRNALSTIKAFRQITGKNLRLFVVGQASGSLRDEMEKAAWGDWRIRCFFQIIPNDQIEKFFKASDFVIMPGIQYLTSAVVTLALSYYRPVIAARYGCAIDMVGEAGILYDTSVSDGLVIAMEQAVHSNLDQYKRLAYVRAESFSWCMTAAKLAKAYQIACQSE